MRTQFLIALVLVAALLPGAAIAQQGAENTTVVQQEEDPTDGCDVRIDRVTRLCEASFDNGRIELVLYSNAPISVSVTDWVRAVTSPASVGRSRRDVTASRLMPLNGTTRPVSV
jgi:hypothetical protein